MSDHKEYAFGLCQDMLTLNHQASNMLKSHALHNYTPRCVQPSCIVAQAMGLESFEGYALPEWQDNTMLDRTPGP